MTTPTNDGHGAACSRVQGRLDELIDGGLSALEAARDEGHLEACAACAAARGRRKRWLVSVQAAVEPGSQELLRAGAGLEALLGQATPPRRAVLALLSGSAGRRATAAISLAASALFVLALLRSLGAIDLPAGDEVGVSLRALEPSALPTVTWPRSPDQLWGGR